MQKMLRNLIEQLAAKCLATTLSYSMVKIAQQKDNHCQSNNNFFSFYFNQGEDAEQKFQLIATAYEVSSFKYDHATKVKEQ